MSDMLASVVDVYPNPTFPDAVQIVIKCPICRKRHYHGALVAELRPGVNLGHRVAHCAGREVGAGYVVGPVDVHV